MDLDFERTKKALLVYTEFKRLHPNSPEIFAYTDANVARWNWHIQERSNDIFANGFSTMDFDPVAADEFFAHRAAKVFSDLLPETRKRFLEIGSLFPGANVYACGSWVNGDWIAGGDKHIMRLRQESGRAEKTESDFDFYIQLVGSGLTMKQIKSRIPSWADFQFRKPKKMIQIPMWDFNKLPENEQQNVIDLFNRRDWGALMELHNRHELSPEHYCCDERPIRRWFAWAIEKGLIKKQENAEAALDS